MTTVLENSRVPVMIAAGASRPLHHAVLLTGLRQKSGDAARFLERLAGPLAMTVTELATDFDSSEPLDPPKADLIVVPVRRGSHEIFRLRPRIVRLLASADRPILVVPSRDL